MHRLTNGQWVLSQPRVVATASGGIVEGAPYQVEFKDNLNSEAAVSLTTSDGLVFKTRVAGLVYYDVSNTCAVLIAETRQNSPGEIVSSNRVHYANAFIGLEADVEYVAKPGSFEQNVILRSATLPAPSQFGLNPQTTRLQVLTELYNTSLQEPASKSGTGQEGDALRLGTMVMKKGKAFLIGKDSGKAGFAHVTKSLKKWEDRTFLVEELPYLKAEQEVRSLPKSSRTASHQSPISGRGKDSVAALGKRLPESPIQTGRQGPLLASAAPVRPGYVIDYELSGTAWDFTFEPGTYHIVSPFMIANSATICGGAVIKSSVSTGDSLTLGDLDGQIILKTKPFQPAVFTSANDDTIGIVLPGSTGQPSSSDVEVAIASAIEFPNLDLHNLSVRYAGTAFRFPCSGGFRLVDVQLVHCDTGIALLGGNLFLGNVLFDAAACLVRGVGPDSVIRAEHITVMGLGSLYDGETGSGFDFTMVNSLVAADLDESGVSLYSSGVVSTNDFCQVAAGNYYLPANSPYRTAGSSGIDGQLAARLRSKTTSPPLFFSNVISQSPIAWTARAIRNTGPLDLGYHYEALDYLTCALTVTNTSATFSNGVAVGFGDITGILLSSNVSAISCGTPGSPNRFVDYRTVQEQPVRMGGSSNGNGLPLGPNRFGGNWYWNGLRNSLEIPNPPPFP